MSAPLTGVGHRIRAHERSLQLWATKHRSWLALAALAGLAAGSALLRSRR
ncbi:MAG TPA: hypothetical protein VMS76_11430 [Planctomycetota bacterium]|nr:hypothetical protein [Planctomycetota bacterium]